MIIFYCELCPKMIFKSLRACLVMFSIGNRCEKSKVIIIKISIIKALNINKEKKEETTSPFQIFSKSNLQLTPLFKSCLINMYKYVIHEISCETHKNNYISIRNKFSTVYLTGTTNYKTKS